MSEQGTGVQVVRLELKYCECCGGLLLRRAGGDVVYCGSCAKKISELPEKKSVRRRKRIGEMTEQKCRSLHSAAENGGSGRDDGNSQLGERGAPGGGRRRVAQATGGGGAGATVRNVEHPVKIGPKSVGLGLVTGDERRLG